VASLVSLGVATPLCVLNPTSPGFLNLIKLTVIVDFIFKPVQGILANKSRERKEGRKAI
jgi:hypothetical protein